MRVFKFGGASIKESEGVRNLAKILANYVTENLLIVVSAMGKTTNAFEKLLNSCIQGSPSKLDDLQKIINYHYQITEQLFPDKNLAVFSGLESLFNELKKKISQTYYQDYDYEYDQIIPYGELMSTYIISEFLNQEGIKNRLFDVREYIKTDNTYREGQVDWSDTIQLIKKDFCPYFTEEYPKIAITQGFIGANSKGESITLGREGSDYSAAIFAYSLDAEEVIIWKDVPGLLNADPKYFKDTVKLDSISYQEAIELAYYGATIIHPKTIKPLENKNIPLRVKCFLEPDKEGSIIHHVTAYDSLISSFIYKPNQVLISLSPRDFSFIAERNLSNIYAVLSNCGIRVNLMQNSAISFTICIDTDEKKMGELINHLKKEYRIRYNSGLELLTIRHYTQELLDKITSGKNILLEQKSRLTAQLVIQKKD